FQPTRSVTSSSASALQEPRAMNPEAEAIKARTKTFALDVLAFVRTLPATDECHDIGDQLRRSGTSVGANYRATCRARSRAEFISKINCALEEADESAFWLELLTEGAITSGRTAWDLLGEADELSRIFVASSITATEAERRGDPDPHDRRRRRS